MENLLAALNTHDFSALFMGGHGNPTTFTGHGGSIVFRACENDEAMSGSLSYFLSCFTGQELGPSIISKNGVAYVGYQSDFRFMVDTSYPILEDPLAEAFRDVVYDIIARILRGQNIKTVWEGGVNKFNEWIAKLHSRPETIWSQVISCLQHDRDGMIALGEKEAYALPPAPIPITSLPYILGPIAIGVALLFL